MVKIPGPLMSVTARGWLGGDTYGKREYEKGVWIEPKRVNPSPYPIGFESNILVPNGWTFSLFGNTYKVPRWGLRPYGPFISNYYSNLGWCYQRRRTWHGIIYSAIRPPISKNKQSPAQAGRQWLFYNAVKQWQDFAQFEKDVYNRWRYPARASGYNRFIRWFMRLGPTMPLYWGNLQRADDDSTKIEDAAVMQHDPHIHYPFQFYNMQAFNMVLHKGAGFPADPVEGQLFYRTDDDKVYKYDGASWVEVGGVPADTNYYSPTVIVAQDASGDYTDIQLAIDALPAGGGRVFVKEGQYEITSPITITKSNVTLEGQGETTNILVGAGSNADVIVVGDGNATYSNIIIKNLYIDGNSANQASGRGIYLFNNLVNVLIQGVHLWDIKDIGIYNEFSDGLVTIARCKIEITGQQGIYSLYCEPMNIWENELITCGNASYASIHLASTYYNRIIGNKITHDGTSNSAHGIIMETACYSDVIGNTIYGANIGYYEYASFMLSQQGNCVVGNNVVSTYSYGMSGPGSNGSCVANTIEGAGDIGIRTGWQDCLIEGNTISYSTFHAIEINSLHYQCIGNSIYIAQMHGIIIRGGAEGVCSGNIVYDSCSGYTNVYTAIILLDSYGTGVKRSIIADNYIYSDSYPKHQSYGIWEAHKNCNYNIVHDNISYGSVRQEIAVQGAYTNAHDNITNS